MKRSNQRPRINRAGFTLMEVLLVLVILVILGSLAGLYIRGTRDKALIKAATAQIQLFDSALQSYEFDIRSYPTTEQGLQALVEAPTDLRNPDKWTSHYLDVPEKDGRREIPVDPWDYPYQYELVDADTYRIWSLGPDGIDGTEDDISK